MNYDKLCNQKTGPMDCGKNSWSLSENFQFHQIATRLYPEVAYRNRPFKSNQRFFNKDFSAWDFNQLFLGGISIHPSWQLPMFQECFISKVPLLMRLEMQKKATFWTWDLYKNPWFKSRDKNISLITWYPHWLVGLHQLPGIFWSSFVPSNRCFNIWRFILLTACNKGRLEGIMLVRQKGIR